MPDLIGQSLGRYHILEQLGEGGMAIVYKAYDTRLETNVAVKVIRTENLAPSVLERSLKRFEREAKALAKLTHTNIVNVLDYGEYEGKPYLVMPFLPAGTLKQKLQGKPLPYQEAIRILIPIANALAYAHQEGMVHRDIKPANILITQSGDPMLTDFGIAKIIDDESTMDLTGTSAAVGTPEYMAPEQIHSKNADHRVDIYALGIVLYEMITGRKPYTADTPLAVLIMHSRDPLPRPRQFVTDLPQAVENILLKALAKEPKDRYQSMGELAAALEGLTKREVGARLGKQKVLDPRPLLQRVNQIPLIVTLSVLMTLAVAGYFLQRLFTTSEIGEIDTTNTAQPAQTRTILAPIEPTLAPTKTPVPTATPLYKTGDVLFEDDFEDGDADGWRIFGSQNWQLIQENNGNHAMQATSPAFSTPLEISNGDLGWYNYYLEFRVNIVEQPINTQYGVGAILRFDFDSKNPPRSNYLVLLNDGAGGINRYKNKQWIDIGLFSYTGLKKQTWHTIRIETFNEKIKVFVDDKFAGEAIDRDPLPAGLIGIGPEDNKEGQILLFDDIRVVELLPNQ